jgi:hypothetical protein
MMRHKQKSFQKASDYNLQMLKEAKIRPSNEGLSTISYKVIEFKLFTSFTYILLDVGTFSPG